MSYDDHLLGQHAIDVRTEAALFAREHAGEPPDRYDPRDDWDPDDDLVPYDQDREDMIEAENHQAHELDTWPYDDAGYLTELTEQHDIHWEDT